jgi:hypothetical protein
MVEERDGVREFVRLPWRDPEGDRTRCCVCNHASFGAKAAT